MVSWSLEGADADLFVVDATTGVVSMMARDFEEPADQDLDNIYNYTLTASDESDNFSKKPVSLFITDRDESAPVITSAATATPIDENSGESQVVYTASATDTADVDDTTDTSAALTYSLKANNNDDAGAFSINTSTGAVTLTANPDHETKSSYSFTVVATDAAGNATEQAVSLSIIDRDESAPVITSAATATPIDENSSEAQVIYTASATDTADVDDTTDTSAALTYSLKANNNDDAGAFSINTSTGAVTLTANPDHETKSSYSFTVVATDAAGNATEQAVSLSIIDRDESAPVITSAATATPIDENSSEAQVVYTASATDTADVDDTTDTSAALTYSLKANNNDDAGAFSINTSTGAVTLTANPDHETKASYSFTVVATDAAGNAATKDVVVSVTDVDEFDVSAPSDSDPSPNSVVENAALATPVGLTASASDDDGSINTVTYSLVSNAQGMAAYSGGEFAIDATSGVVRVAGGIDHEAGATRVLFVKASSADGSSAISSFTIDVSDVNDNAPLFSSGATGNVAENAATATVIYQAVTTDADGTAANREVLYSLKAATGDAAALTIDSSTGAVRLRASADHETKASYSFTVVATNGAQITEQPVTVNVTDVNEAPTAISLSANTIAENVDTSAGVLIGTLSITDPDASGNTNVLSLGGTDAASFEIRNGSELFFTGSSPDFEAKSSYAVTVTSTDSGLIYSEAFTVNVTDVNEAPTAISLSANTIAENVDTSAGVLIGTLSITDPDASGNTNLLSLGGTDAASFEIRNGSELFFTGSSPDFEAKPSYAVTVTSTDGALAYSEAFTVNVTDVNEAPTAISLSANTIGENVDTSAGVLIGTLSITDPDASGNNNVLSLEGTDAGSFEIRNGTELFFTGSSPDFEAKPSYAVTVKSIDGGLIYSEAFTVNVTDVNEAPTALGFTNTLSSLPENTTTSSPIKVAAIAISDDALGTNTITLSGADADSFEVIGTELFLKAGTVLDFEAKTSYAVTVTASDPDLPGSTPVSAGFSLAVTDDVEPSTLLISNLTDSSVAENSSYSSAAPNVSGAIGAISWSVEGVDARHFSVDPATGEVSMAAQDFEAPADSDSGNSYAYTLRATDSDGNTATKNVVVSVTDVDEFDVSAPSDSDPSPNSVVENAALATPVGLTASASDADGSTNTVTYSLVSDAQGTAAYSGGEFAIDATSGVVRVAGGIDHEAGATRVLFVKASSADGSSAISSFTVNVSDVNDNAPLFSSGATGSVAENAATATVIYQAVTTDADGTASNREVLYSLKAATGDVAALTIDSSTGAVRLKASADHETKTSYSFTVVATNGAQITEQPVTVNVTDVNEAPTAISLSANTIAENVDTSAGVLIGTLSISDPDASGNTNVLTLEGTDAASFEIRNGTELFFTGSSPDFEAKPSYAVTVTSSDGALTYSQAFTVNVTDVNEAPTAMGFTNTVTSLAENTSTSRPIKVAAIAISDDALGANTIRLSGADAASFELVGTELFLMAGTVLDFEAKTSYAVTVTASDPGLPGSTPVSAGLSLAVTDVNEPPTSTGINDIAVTENDSPTRIDLRSVFNDPDPIDATLSYSLGLNSNPELVNAVIDAVTGSLTLSYSQSTTGTAQIRVLAKDSQLQTASSEFSVSVVPFDANNDGIADKEQANVIAIATPGQSFLAVVAEPGIPAPSIDSTPNPAPDTTPQELTFSEGFLEVNYAGLAPGGSTTLQVFLPSGSNANSYWKYGPTSPGGASQWYDFIFDPITRTGARFEDLNGDGQDDIVLHFVDGQRGDDDFTANGRISDPGGPAFDPNAAKETVSPVSPEPEPLNPTRPPQPSQPIQPAQPPQPGRPRTIRATEELDRLTGTPQRDSFVFQGVQSNSTKRRLKFDVITNFASNDRIRFRQYNERVLDAADASRIDSLQGRARKLSTKALNQVLGRDFKGKTVAALEIRRFDGTFLAVNGGARKVEGGRAGFDRRDMLIFLQGYDLQEQGPIQLHSL